MLTNLKEVEISIKKNTNVDFSVFEFNLGHDIIKSESDTYIKYKGTRLKKYKQNPSSVKGSYYLPHLIVSVKSTQKLNETSKVLTSTNDMYNWYNALIQELKPDESYIKALTASLLKSDFSEEKKITAIFNWVQNNIQYVAFEYGIAGFKPAEADEVAKLKRGDCKGMANLLVNMLKSAGFTANHAWIGTRSNNYNYSIPSLLVDNHMICALDFKDQRYYLDGTSKSAVWQIPPPHLEGKEVLVAQNTAYQVDTIQKSMPENNMINIIGKLDIQSPLPQFNFDIELKGHFMRDYISYLNYVPLELQEDIPFLYIKDYLEGCKVEDIKGFEIGADKISYTISGTYLNFAKNKQSLTIFPFLNIINYDFLEELNPPTYVDFPHIINVVVEIEKEGMLAPSYGLQEVGTDAYYGSFDKESKDNKIIIQQKLYMNVLHSPLNKSPEWNEFLSQMMSLYSSPLTYKYE